FQAEDGIRDLIVTGVQTCALPIFAALLVFAAVQRRHARPQLADRAAVHHVLFDVSDAGGAGVVAVRRTGDRRAGTGDRRFMARRSEERRVGKEGSAGASVARW